MVSKVKQLIEHYQLAPLAVEGTLFKRTYCSNQVLDNGKPIYTSMIALYCEEPRSVSLFHRLPVDEMWHFYGGDPLRLVLLYEDGSSKDVILGSEPFKGQHVQFVVPAGVWQAGHMLDGGEYSLYGCTLSPGFTEDMFEGGTYERLIKEYPERAGDITMFCCEEGKTSMPAGSET